MTANIDDYIEQQEAAIEAQFAGRDLQFEHNRVWMTSGQLERAAHRLTMKTRVGGATRDEKARGISDYGTDAACVADAYLKITRDDRDAMNLIRRAAGNIDALEKRLEDQLGQLETRPRVDLTKLKMLPTIQLASGRYFDFVNPDSTPLEIDDLAAGLSRICRYTGQLAIDEDEVYTVAQHSVLASENCGPDCDPYEALLHDRAESVMNDMASPLKQLLPDYKEIEDRVETSTGQYYGVEHPMSAGCKAIDIRMLATEKRDLMPHVEGDTAWAGIENIEPLPFKITPWSPSEARHRFLHRFYWLTEGRLPKPEDRYARPHENAPKDYIEALEKAWGFYPFRAPHERRGSFTITPDRWPWQSYQGLPTLPPDYGLKEQVRPIGDTQDVGSVLRPDAAA
ncbi:deoxyribonucleoside 5' monophosphate phosphatase [Caulobacter phage CcrPW]|uniref:Putative HD superfamily hydrolase n=1 Tax=Caulobacter phage CcrPW TaxID=2283271 RepID=A0A385E9X0_9CAUD|nr:deoxyribonucleoside 5' monophosphate phosphatase [Caulobacter phage CcrPW]AXQ68603.1 putative HD superfamily hydrolase [Caulobacter phage CcrPW]